MTTQDVLGLEKLRFCINTRTLSCAMGEWKPVPSTTWQLYATLGIYIVAWEKPSKQKLPFNYCYPQFFAWWIAVPAMMIQRVWLNWKDSYAAYYLLF
jgi:hypothetical protein